MRSSRKIEFSPEAENDFGLILAYSLSTWGEQRRNAYADRILISMHELLSHSLLGHARDDLRPGLRARLAGQHMIYYLADESTIRIVRVLHTKMDPARHLHPTE